MGFDASQRLEVGGDILFSGIVEVKAFVGPLHEHRLDDAMALEEFEACDLLLDIVVPSRPVYSSDIIGVDCVELQDVVVEVQKRFANLRTAYLCGVREDAHLGGRAFPVANLPHFVDNLGEVRVKGRLSVPGKGQDVWNNPILLKFNEFAFQSPDHFFDGGQRVLCAAFFVQAAFAIDAVEAAHFTTFRQEIDAERNAQSTAVNGAENGGIVDDCAHNLCKGTKIN